MKRIICAVLIVIFLCGSCLIFLTACNNDDFEYVGSITITTSGETKTFSSRASLKESASKYITEEEYNNAPENEKMGTSYSSVSVKLPPDEQKGCIAYFERFDEKKVCYYIEFTAFRGDKLYRKVTYEGINYYYIQVKVKNDSTIIIKDLTGTTTYIVTSYKIASYKK